LRRRGDARSNSRLVVHHGDVLQRIDLPEGQICPAVGVGVQAVHDRLKVQVASRRPSGGSYLGDDFSDAHGLALRYPNRLKVVVGGDQAVAMFNLNTVAATPKVPTDGPDHPGVGGVDTRAACGGVILAPVEFAGKSGQRTVAVAVWRAGIEDFKRRVKAAGWWTRQAGRSDSQAGRSVLGHGPDKCAVEVDHGRASLLGRWLGHGVD